MRQQRSGAHTEGPRQSVAAHTQHTQARQKIPRRLREGSRRLREGSRNTQARQRRRRRRGWRGGCATVARLASVQQHAKRRRHEDEARGAPLAQHRQQRVRARRASDGNRSNGTPFASGPTISQSESTKPSGVLATHTSSGANGYASHIQLQRACVSIEYTYLRLGNGAPQPARASRPARLPSTPFDSPVEPEV